MSPILYRYRDFFLYGKWCWSFELPLSGAYEIEELRMPGSEPGIGQGDLTPYLPKKFCCKQKER